VTRVRPPSSALDALLGQLAGSVAWQDAFERLEGPHVLGDGPALEAALALPVMQRLQPEFERRHLKLVGMPVQEQGEAALYLTLSQPRGPRHLIGTTEHTPTGGALRLYAHPLAQVLGVFSQDGGPVAALFAPAPDPMRLTTHVEVSVDHPGGILDAAYERLKVDWPHLIAKDLTFEVAGYHGRTLVLEVTVSVGHGPEGLKWAESDVLASPATPG